jgi:predicted MFS family arabinose efflux permease
MNGAARYGASFIYVGGMYTANPLISTWVSSTMGRTPENRAIAVALCNVLGQVGNVIAPYFFRKSDDPRYQLAFILMMVCALVAITATMSLKFHLKHLNKKLYQKSLRDGTVYQPYVT